MSKFKFGDKVWHRKFGFGVITSNRPQDVEYSNIDVAFKEYKGTTYTAYVGIPSLTPAFESDWIKCSERMPETYTKVLVLVEVGNDSKQHIFVDELYESTKYGMLWQNNDNLVTHWMPLPTPPMGSQP